MADCRWLFVRLADDDGNALFCIIMQIVPLLPQHAEAVLEIYRQGIASGVATFETEVPGWEKFAAKYLEHSRLLAMEGNEVAGWAALSPVSTRDCYKGVAEVSVYVYVHPSFQGRGTGKSLLMQLIASSEQQGIWSLLSVIHEENAPSIQLHLQCGFRIIGHREKIAQLNGQWKTTVMMERRSTTVGV
jgi:L-amino acid N-acyltransferase YncA